MEDTTSSFPKESEQMDSCKVMAIRRTTMKDGNLCIANCFSAPKVSVVERFHCIQSNLCLNPQKQSLIEICGIQGVCHKRFHYLEMHLYAV